MTTLLIFTTGQTDVQLVVTGDDRAVRQELDGKTCGKLHDQIKQRSWRVVDAPAEKANQRASALPDGNLTLCTPKLDAVLNYFTNELPSAALILETRRTMDSDPRFAGAMVEQHLRNRGVSRVQRHAFLEGNERLEDQTNAVDAIVRRSVVESLSKAIAGVIEEAKPTNIVAATTGGLAAVNAVIEELVHLYAVSSGAEVTVLEVPDAAIANQIDCAIEETFHPATGYHARWQALSLIEKGNLLGAWGAIKHIEDEPGQEWIRVVKWLARFASSLPMPGECNISILKHEHMAVRAALRVEFALRAGDIPRAVHGTVAFFESALWDWLRQRDFTCDDGASGSLEQGFTFSQNPIGKEKKQRFKDNGQRVWKINDFKPGVTAWLHVLNKPALSALQKALSDDIRELRNDVAHNEPTPQLMDSARDQMQNAQLWSTDQPPEFLSQPLVQNVLKELGINQPDSLCKTLLDTVRAHLLTSSQPANDGRKE